jgi:Ubiquitin-like domain
MELIEQICKEEPILKLKITPNSSLAYINNIKDLEKGEAFVLYIERFDKKKLSVIAKPDSTARNIWKNLRNSNNFSSKRINWNTIKRKYELVFNGNIITDQTPISILGIQAGSLLKFLRKVKS